MRLLVPLAVLLALAIPSTLGTACTEPVGEFIATAESPCLESPVLFCTRGTLTGDVAGSYDFVMTSQSSAADPAHPTRLIFAGESLITTGQGRMFAADHGRMDVNATGPWPFETIVKIHGGDGAYEGAKGRLVATGSFDPEAGITSGTYVGTLCA